VDQRQNLAVPGEHPDQTIGRLLSVEAACGNRRELDAAPGKRHRHSGGESGGLHRLFRSCGI